MVIYGIDPRGDDWRERAGPDARFETSQLDRSRAQREARLPSGLLIVRIALGVEAGVRTHRTATLDPLSTLGRSASGTGTNQLEEHARQRSATPISAVEAIGRIA